MQAMLLLLLELIVAACLLQARRGVCQDFSVFVLHPQSSVAKPGDEVVLNCETNNPSDMIQWKLNGTDINVPAGPGTLTIDSIADEDQGNYSCVAIRTIQNNLRAVSSAEAYISLAFLSSPHDDETETVVVDPGNYTVLPCIPLLDSLPAPRFTWYRKFSSGHTSAGLSTINSAVEGPNGKAILRHVDQAQTYRCEVDNDVLGQSVQYTTEVTLSGTTVTIDAPVMLESPKDALVNPGDSVYLYCIATDTQAVIWSLNGEELVLENGGNIDVTIPGETTTLLIQQVDQASAGVYTCSHPTLGQHNATVSIRDPPNIIDPPDPSMTIDYGASFSLWCMVDETVLKYNWYLNGTQLSDDTNLLQRDFVTYESAGTYQCYAYNEAGNDSFATFVSVFAEAPSIDKPPPPKLVGFLGDNLDISCLASGTPPPVYSWSVNGDQFEEVEGGNLVIDSLEPTDSGTYTCMATNEIGSSATASTEVLVVEPTIVGVMPSNVVVHVGQDFSLHCNETHDDGTLVELAWFFNDVLVESIDRRNLTKAEGSVVLRISSAEDGDAGEYYCQGTTTLTDYTIGSPVVQATSSVTVSPSPVRPVVTMVEALSPTSVMVSWTYAGVVDNLENFVIEITEASSNMLFTQAMVNPKAETRTTVTGLIAYTKYVVRVGAVEVGSQDGPIYNNLTTALPVTTLEDVPNPPTSVSVVALEGGTSISVSWKALEPPDSNGLITGYTVRYFQTNLSDSEYSQGNMSDSRLTHFVDGNVTSYTIPDLTPDTDYTIDVAGHTRIGMGKFSKQVSARTLSTEAASPIPLWFVALMVVVVVLLVVLVGLVIAIAYWRRGRGGGKYPVSHSKSSCDTSEPMTEDAILDYEHRKRDMLMLTTFDGADSEIDGSAVTLPTTISSLGPSHYRMNVMAPPSYINPPSFEETLRRAKSSSMTVIERPPAHVQYGSGWSMGHAKQNHSDVEFIDPQAVLGAESGSSEDSGEPSPGNPLSSGSCASYV